MNPHALHSTTFKSMLLGLWQNKNLIGQLTRREVVGRYKGSMIGLAWSFLNPLFMLVVYTFVFSVVFKARWGTGVDESKTQFAVILFIGLIAHGLFAEVLNRASTTIISNTNYVKKVVFPLEVLVAINMGSALFHLAASVIVLLVALVIFNGGLHWTTIFLPLVLMPLIILCMGLSWIIASLGVFVRDMGQAINILTTVMLFLSPVFFPITALPEQLRPVIMFNPLTFIIEQARAVTIWGLLPNWQGILIYTVVALLVAWAGYAWFQKTRKGFADVL